MNFFMTLLVAVAIIYLVITSVAFWVILSKIVIIEDVIPKGPQTQARVMQLGNELLPYIKENDGKISIKVLK